MGRGWEGGHSAGNVRLWRETVPTQNLGAWTRGDSSDTELRRLDTVLRDVSLTAAGGMNSSRLGSSSGGLLLCLEKFYFGIFLRDTGSPSA